MILNYFLYYYSSLFVKFTISKKIYINKFIYYYYATEIVIYVIYKYIKLHYKSEYLK